MDAHKAMIAYVSGEKLQVLVNAGEWTDIADAEFLATCIYMHYTIRVKPKTINVNGFEVPAPVPAKDGVQEGVTVYIPSVSGKEFVIISKYAHEHEWQTIIKDRGLVYLNKNDAIARAKAMLGIDPAWN